jgi:hypothetical protein
VTAAGWEAALHAGQTFPFYEQSFEFDPGALTIPGATVTQRGIFRLDAKGGLALGASLAWQGSVVGLEARVDTADVRVETEGARYDVTVRVPVIGTLTTPVDLGGGTLDLERLRPMSLNLRVRTRGRVGFGASGGVSYLPAFRFEVRQRVSVGIPVVGPGGLDLAGVALTAEALPEQEGDGRLGWNAGGGLRYELGERALLVVEGRYFWFQRQTLFWGEPVPDAGLPQLQSEVVRQVAARLEPVRFNPTFFQATAAIGLRF